MRGLGRLIALPWLLIALAVQALAPADAAAMRPDAAAMGICSAGDLGGGAHRSDPRKSHDHDCCAFACALTGLAAAPPVPSAFTRATFEAPAEMAPIRRLAVASPSPLERPRSRGPPSLIPTT